MQNANADSLEKKKTANPEGGFDETDARYERLDKLGEGTYGIVYKARDRETNEVNKLFLFNYS